MELRHIRYFLAVAEARNFTRAAFSLGIGQPPLSQQIKNLEAEVDAVLFRRTGSGAELTAAGHAFLREVRDMPNQAHLAAESARRAARGETGSIRLGYTGSAAFNPHVPTSIRAFRRRFPEVELTLQESNSNGLVDGLVDGTLDAAFLRPEAVGSEELTVYEFEREPMIAALPTTRMEHGLPISLADLRDDPFIMTPRPLGPTLYDATMAACRAAGFDPALGQTAPQIASVIALVAAEMGVALVPASMRDVAMRGISYHDLVDHVPFASLAIAHRRGDHSPTVAAFVTEARFASADLN